MGQWVKLKRSPTRYEVELYNGEIRIVYAQGVHVDQQTNTLIFNNTEFYEETEKEKADRKKYKVLGRWPRHPEVARFASGRWIVYFNMEEQA